MRHSDTRILTTHVGSIVRSPDLLRLAAETRDRPDGQPRYAAALTRATADIVARQQEAGLDIVNDGEYGKSSWANYVLERMTDSPERVAVAHDNAEGLRQALGGLPVPQARAVAMAGIYGMTARQVADAEGIPLGTAKTRIRDGMQKLRAAYLPEETGSPEEADDE